VRGFEKRRIVAGIVLAAAGLQVGLAGAAFFARQSAERDLASESQRREVLEARIQVAESVEPRELVATPKWTLAHSSDVSGTLQIIQHLGDASGVSLTGLKAAKSKTDGKQTFQITGVGAPTDVCAFVAAIEQHDRLIVVETGRILPRTETTIVFEIGLSTYHPTREGAGQ
jgi:hypothetical protein